MTKGYLIANIQVHDEDGFETFKKMSGPIISEYGGKILVRNPKPVVKEESSSKPKKKAGLQLIVDNKPKRKIKKENTNIDSIIDDLNLLAKKIR